jgi:hypothetical protein
VGPGEGVGEKGPVHTAARNYYLRHRTQK